MAQAGLAAPVVVIAGLGTIDSAVEAMRRGAVDYAVKPLIGDDFLERVERGLTHAAAKRTRRFEPHAHAAARWADAVVALTESHTDVRTIGQWARAVGASASTVRAWCQRANVSPRRSLVLARLLRAVHHSEGRPWQPAQRLHVTDSRTLAGMLAAGGLSTSADRVTIAQLLDGQTLIEDPETLVEFRRRLERPDRAPISS